MNKKLKLIVSTLVLCVTFNVSFPVIAAPENKSINEHKIKYQELNSEIKEINEKISGLDMQIAEINLSLEENTQKIEDTKLEIENIKNLLIQNEKEILEAQNKLNIRIRSLYKSNLNSNIILFIFNSESFSDLFNRIHSVSKIVSLDRELMKQIDEKKDKLEQTSESLMKSEDELILLNEQITKHLDEVEIKKEEQQLALNKINEQRDEIFKVIEANEKMLVENPLLIINSANSSISQIQDAINTLEGLLPQLSSSYVIGLAQDAIYEGNLIIEEANTPPVTTPSLDGDVKATYQMKSTAYTGGGLTAMGLKPIHNPSGISTIAVDPNVIPLGSKVYVSGYGVAIASDTGGAIKGNIVDVYFNTLNECISWGRRSVEVTVLAYPGEW